MPRYRLRSICLYLAGIVMVLSAGAHGALGWPGLATALHEVNAPPDLVTGLAIGWYFGTATMVALGLIVFVAARRLWQGDKTAATYVWQIAAVYLLFGLGALFATSFNPFFLLFVGIGVLTGLPLIGLSRAA